MFARLYTLILLLGVALSPASLAGNGRLQPVSADHEAPGTGVSGPPRDAGRALTDWMVWEQGVGRTGPRPVTGGGGLWALPADELRELGRNGEFTLEFSHSRALRLKARAVPSSPRSPPALG